MTPEQRKLAGKKGGKTAQKTGRTPRFSKNDERTKEASRKGVEARKKADQGIPP